MKGIGRTPGDPTPFRGPRGGRAEQQLVQALDTALRLARLHTMQHDLTREAQRNLSGHLADYLRQHERISLTTSEGWLLLNDRVLDSDEAQNMVDDFVHLLVRNGLGGLLFTGRWDEPEVQQLLTAFSVASLGNADQRRSKFERALDLPADTGIEVYAPSESDTSARAASALRSMAESGSRDQELQLDDADLATYAYFRLVALAEAVLEAAAAERPLEVFAQATRLSLIKVIDALASQTFTRRLQGLTLLAPDPETPLSSHLANVAVHALGMGRLLGLHPQRLLELGFAAFFHDVGRGVSGREPATQRVGERRQTAEPHVLHGLRLAIDVPAVDGADLARVQVAQEHHRVGRDGTYPARDGLSRPHLFSRIVAVADAFDRLENGTPWRAPLAPAHALRALDEQFDATLVDLLRDTLGRYPRGTTLRLPDGSLVVVVEGGARRGHRPVARPLQARGKTKKLTELHQDVEVEVIGPQHVSPGWRIQALP